MRDVNSAKFSFIEFIKKDWVTEYAKRILFAVFLIVIINYAYNYVKALTLKIDPYDILTMNCSVTDNEITVKVKEWAENKEPELKYDGIQYRYDEKRAALIISLFVGEEGDGKPYEEYPIRNKYKKLKKVIIEGGILNIHQRVIWDDGEETMAVAPSPTPAESQKGRR